MKKPILFATAAAVLISLSAGCSSSNSAAHKTGTLPPGTAKFIVMGKNAGATLAVHCWTQESQTIITVGEDASGATAMVSQDGGGRVQFVRLHDIGGFSGGYNNGLEGDAKVTMVDSTYNITGTAVGFSKESPEPTTQPFQMQASC